MSKVIALSGYKQSGKDTIANYLVQEFGYTRLGFADILKDMVAEQYDIQRSWLDDPAFKEKPLPHLPIVTADKFNEVIHNFMAGEFKVFKKEDGDAVEFIKCWTPRALAILEGSVKRSVNSNYWVSRVVKQITANPNSRYVISDLRYRSEIAQLKKALGDQLLTCRVTRFDSVDSVDPSERDLDGVEHDCGINNVGTLDDLYVTTEMILAGR